MSRRKRHEDDDENMKIYPDVPPASSRSLPDLPAAAGPKRRFKAGPARLGGGTVKNNQGWSK